LHELKTIDHGDRGQLQARIFLALEEALQAFPGCIGAGRSMEHGAVRKKKMQN
jgi:hypothetical protein